MRSKTAFRVNWRITAIKRGRLYDVVKSYCWLFRYSSGLHFKRSFSSVFPVYEGVVEMTDLILQYRIELMFILTLVGEFALLWVAVGLISDFWEE